MLLEPGNVEELVVLLSESVEGAMTFCFLKEVNHLGFQSGFISFKSVL